MKKLLLTSALVAGFASSALAHSGPTVTLGGNLDTQLGVRNQSSGYDTDAAQAALASRNKTHNFAVVNHATLNVGVAGKAGNGLKYGGDIEIAADTSNDKYNTNNFNSAGNRTRGWAESMFGRLEAGSTEGVSHSMQVSGASVARATGGIDGDAQYWWNPFIFQDSATVSANERLVSDNFIVSPNLPSNYKTNGEANAAKVNYMTPSYMGFKAGLSYIPDVEQHGSAALTHTVKKGSNNLNFGATTDQTMGFKDIFSGGLHYSGKMNKLGVMASLLGETGDAKDKFAAGNTNLGKRHDLRAWQIGGSVNMSGFSLAASYGDWGKSGVLKTLTTGKKKSHYWTVGAGYEYGAMGMSVTYLDSQRGGIQDGGSAGNFATTAGVGSTAATRGNKHRNVSVGLDYKLAPGFMPYAEVSFFKHHEKGAVGTSATSTNHDKKNEGTIFLAGTKLAF